MAASESKPQRPAGKSRRNESWVRTTTLVLCGIGMMLSVYSVYVEVLFERLPGYQAWCDMGPTISCTRVFSSRWGKGFGLVELVLSKDSIFNQPNGVFGMAAYTFLVFMSFQPEFPAALVQTGVGLVMNMGSVYLGYILFYIIRDICVICIGIYLTNFLIFLTSLVKLRRAYQTEMKKLK